jgi:hypothetical protein
MVASVMLAVNVVLSSPYRQLAVTFVNLIGNSSFAVERSLMLKCVSKLWCSATGQLERKLPEVESL